MGAEVERQLRRDGRHRHRRIEGTCRCGRRGRRRLHSRHIGSGSSASAHHIDADTKSRSADPECVHVSADTKSEGALRNAYRGGNRRVERRAAGRTRHGASEVDDIRTGPGHLCGRCCRGEYHDREHDRDSRSRHGVTEWLLAALRFSPFGPVLAHPNRHRPPRSGGHGAAAAPSA